MENQSNFIPSSDKEALNWVTPALDRVPRELSDDAFKRAWAAIFYLYPGLHPDDALEHGDILTKEDDEPAPIPEVDPRLILPRYAVSGWPVALAPMAEEAWKRYESNMLEEESFYCSEAQMAGMMDRRAS
ncbi:MAG TPA: hypothetical protein PKD45_01780 [Flavobacteriales bacterium]|nr:hypothetical protein [Flavobacteriales bacterium]